MATETATSGRAGPAVGAAGLDLQELTDELRVSWGPTTYRRAGDILIRIHEAGLYKEKARTFKAYCRDELDISDAQAYQTMSAARFATLVEEDAPALPPPASEFTFRPMGRLPTGADRLECWRLTIERVAPALPTHEDVKATVAALEGGEPAGPGTRARKAARDAAEANPATLLARGFKGLLLEAEIRDNVVEWLAGELRAEGLEPATADGRALTLMARSTGGPLPFALAFACGDPAATRTTSATEEVPTPPEQLTAVSHRKGKAARKGGTVEPTPARPAKAGRKAAAKVVPTPEPEALTAVSESKASGLPTSLSSRAREFVRRFAPGHTREEVAVAAASEGLNARRVREAVVLLCETEARKRGGRRVMLCRIKAGV